MITKGYHNGRKCNREIINTNDVPMDDVPSIKAIEDAVDLYIKEITSINMIELMPREVKRAIA
jgi:hypothetical protein